MLSEDMDAVLREYFRWARSGCPSDITYPHSDPTQQFRGASVRSLGLSDDEALWVDAAISKIQHSDEKLHELLIAYYGQGKTMTQLRARFGSRKKIARDLTDARAFVLGVLYAGSKTGVPREEIGIR